MSFSTPYRVGGQWRRQCILATLLYHGMRREELCGLRVRDMQSPQGVLHFRVMGKRGKIRFIDRFYLETDFSKGHPSQILNGKRSPSLATMIRLSRALGVRVADFFDAST